MAKTSTQQPLSSAKSLLFRSGNLFQRGLKLSHLRMIVAMEETGQISLAADMLKTSQPAASRLLSEMEMDTYWPNSGSAMIEFTAACR